MTQPSIHRWLLTLFLVAVAVQFGLAGLGAFKVRHGTERRIDRRHDQFADDFSPHPNFANVLTIIGLLLLIVRARSARMGKHWILVSARSSAPRRVAVPLREQRPELVPRAPRSQRARDRRIAGKNVDLAWRHAKEACPPRRRRESAEFRTCPSDYDRVMSAPSV